MSTEETTPQEDNLNINESKLICPCCHKPTLEAPVKINNDTLDHFLSCLLTHSPFFYTYKLFDGKIKVTCTELNESDKSLSKNVSTELSDLVINGVLEEQKGIAIANTIYLMMRLKDIEVSTHEATLTYQPQQIASVATTELLDCVNKYKEDKNPKNIIDAIDECYKKVTDPNLVSSVPMSMLATVQETHASVYSLLLDSGFNENFWKGIELA